MEDITPEEFREWMAFFQLKGEAEEIELARSQKRLPKPSLVFRDD